MLDDCYCVCVVSKHTYIGIVVGVFFMLIASTMLFVNAHALAKMMSPNNPQFMQQLAYLTQCTEEEVM